MQATDREKNSGMSIDSASGIVFTWLLLLRWGAVACQAILILAVSLFFDIHVPIRIVSFILVFECVSNLYFLYLKRRKTIPGWLINAVMFLDVGLLTVLLYYTGGPMNPFTFLYLVHIVLGAIVMRPIWSWGLAFFAVLCYAGFFFPDLGGSAEGLGVNVGSVVTEVCHDLALQQQGRTDHLQRHLQGMWLAFSVTAFFIVFFVGRIQQALEEHQRIVAKLQEEKGRNEKLASLATLAAGAAHEFSTPLSTIAVAAGEMLHCLKARKDEVQLLEDATLIREQVNKCKEIIFQMAADAGEHLGEDLEALSLRQLVRDSQEAFLAEEPSGKVIVQVNEPGIKIRVPHRAFVRALKGLLKNAHDASPPGTPVVLSCRVEHQFLLLEVEDTGTGMDPVTAAKACEPFFTRKNVGQGLGLGLYLAKSFAERFGGGLVINSVEGQGTKVILRLSLKVINAS
jgi:two-component system sensor histidine kinase RegB